MKETEQKPERERHREGGCSHLAAVTYSGVALVMLLGMDPNIKPALNNVSEK